MRSALAALVEDEDTMELVEVVADAQEAIAAAARHKPNVAILDVRMPGGGAAAARAIAQSSPATQMLALSAQRDRDTVLEMLEAGAVGYLTKGSPIETIVDSIVRAASGQASLSAEITGAVIEQVVEQRNELRRSEKRKSTATARIRRALDEEGFLEVVFQPIYELAKREIVGVEALARFRGPPQRGPDRWFAEAAQVGLRTELELAAVRKALAALPLLAPPLFLSINVSPSTIMTAAFRKLIVRAKDGRIVIEITEHAPIADYERLGAAVDRLRAEGVRLAIDDAGAGFASLRHILRLAPELIKLDRTLIHGIEVDRAQQALAAGLTSFAQGIDATIVAEGIEYIEELSVLEKLGVACGQGYYLGRPGPLPD